MDADDGLNIHFVERTRIQARKLFPKTRLLKNTNITLDTRGVHPNNTNHTSSSSNWNRTTVPTSGGSGGKVEIVDGDDEHRWIVLCPSRILNWFFGDVREGGNANPSTTLTNRTKRGVS